MDLEVGSDFAGYRLEAVAGRGGMGIVFRARNLITDQERALKVIAPQMSSDVQFRERFKRESRLAARLDHPNVISIYEAREEDGLLYLVMPLVEGSDLGSVLMGQGRLDLPRALPIVSQVAAALDAAHSAGLIHRDVKPANVLLATGSPKEKVYLTDFGLVKDLGSSSSLTESGVFMGTYNYAAPEQIDPSGGRRVDHRADIYAFACLIYHALAGVVPFPRDSVQAAMAAHLFLDPPDIREERSDLPSALSKVLQRSMAKDPADRHETAGQLALAVSVVSTSSHSSKAGPEIPSAARRGHNEPARPLAPGPASSRREQTPELDRPSSSTSAARDRSKRRTGLIVTLALAAVGAVIGVSTLTGGSPGTGASGSKSSKLQKAVAQMPAAAMPTGPGVKVLGQIDLKPIGNAEALGIAYVVQRGSQKFLVVQGQLPPLPNSQKVAAYEVWLYNTNSDARSVGAQYTNTRGLFQGRAPLGADYAKFKAIDISRELFSDRNPGHGTDSILRGALADIRPVP